MKCFRFITVVALTLGFGCTSSPSATGDDDSDATTPTTTAARTANLTAFFAVPLADGTPDAALETKVIELAGQAVAGSKVHIAMYGWSRKPVAQAFIDAYTRGADVKIVLDRQQNEVADDDDPQTKSDLDAAIAMLQAGLPAGSVTLCTRGDGSCQGDHINHNKFYLFSELSDGSKNVVVQSSANLTGHHLHNNLVIDRNDKDLYAGYLSYFDDLVKQKLDLDYYRSVDGNQTIAYFFPRAEGDTIVSVLDKVKCTTSSKIRVAMAFFDTGRIAIADRLVTLAGQGCDVKVLMRKAGPDDSADVIKTLRGGGVTVGLYPDAGGSNIHSKYLLIDSKYDTVGQGDVHRQLVFTGSHNYLTTALRDNDETLLRVDDAAVFADFMANWDTIHAQIPTRLIKS